ncbi:MAG: hypothetical protein N3F09_07780 [Bacteroidia bacterium]|nr:hypothetical protein [Bacteroidia bacterium]
MKLVFRLYVIILSIILLNPEEFSKIPFLIDHYYEHLEKNNLDFIDFLSLHYNNPIHEKSNEEHHHLPLKHDNECCLLSVKIHYSLPTCFYKYHLAPEIHKYIVIEGFNYFFNLTSNIWNPPRFF